MKEFKSCLQPNYQYFKKRFGILRKGSYIHGIEIKVMANLENIKRAIELQKESNHQIDMLGEANEAVVFEMLELVDSFSLEDCAVFMELWENEF